MNEPCEFQPSPRTHATALLAGVLLLVFTFSALHSVFDPLGRDQSLFHLITLRMMDGQRLYLDLWTQNTPTVLGVHWLGIRAFGPDPIGVRIVDAAWQAATLVALVMLGRRTGRTSLGLGAGLLYTLAYYGFGYSHTAQREGFAVLPLVLAVDACLAGAAADTARRAMLWQLAAGVLGFLVFAFKPPLGLCYGGLWLWSLARAAQARTRISWAGLCGLTLGFSLAALVAGWIAWQAGWWADYQAAAAENGFSEGFMLGPRLIRAHAGEIAVGLCALVLLAWRQARGRLAAAAVLGVLLFAWAWPFLGNNLLGVAGVVIPALGAIAAGHWRSRPVHWQLMLSLAAAGFGAVLLQGRWSAYRMLPMVACLAWLAAEEIGRRGIRLAWLAACLGACVHLTAAHWWPMVADVPLRPVLTGAISLDQHASRVTNASSSIRHATMLPVAARVRALTRPGEPIACLFYDPMLYILSDRPPVHRLLAPAEVYETMYARFFDAIARKRPAVILARMSDRRGPSGEPAEDAVRVFAEIKRQFGAPAEPLPGLYTLDRIVDDVAILRAKP